MTAHPAQFGPGTVSHQCEAKGAEPQVFVRWDSGAVGVYQEAHLTLDTFDRVTAGDRRSDRAEEQAAREERRHG